jgi:hypothetical protein
VGTGNAARIGIVVRADIERDVLLDRLDAAVPIDLKVGHALSIPAGL